MSDKELERLTKLAEIAGLTGSVVGDYLPVCEELKAARAVIVGVRSMISGAIRMIEGELGSEGASRWQRPDPMVVVAEAYGRYGPMCQQIDAYLARYPQPAESEGSKG